MLKITASLKPKTSVTYDQKLIYSSGQTVLMDDQIIVTVQHDVNVLNEFEGVLAIGDVNGFITLVRLADFEVVRIVQLSKLPILDIIQTSQLIAATLEGVVTENRVVSEEVAVSLASFDSVLLLALTDSRIAVVVNDKVQAYLNGHSNWVKDMDIKHTENGCLLATCSLDKYIRVWSMQYDQPVQEGLHTSVTTVQVQDRVLTIQLDSVLQGHEDYVYSVKWYNDMLVSSSADKSLILWEQDEVWSISQRFFDQSSQGSNHVQNEFSDNGGVGSSGFYNGLMIKDQLVGHAFQGSLQYFNLVTGESTSKTGHFDAVKGVCWSPSGKFLLTTSLDKTARLWARIEDQWTELCRPQIHGYPLLKAAFMSDQAYVSCGEGEKVLRVFEASPLCQSLMERSSGQVVSDPEFWQQDAAVLPVLGLSNKAQTTEVKQSNHEGAILPQETHLSAVTLWPEVDKLYGHGDDMFTLEISHNKKMLVSANVSRQSYSDIAHKEGSLRLWLVDGTSISLLKVFDLHTQTVTAMSFSSDDSLLVTVGRDRSLNIISMADHKTIKVKDAHSRMIWDVCWCPDDSHFITASRDKSIKVWSRDGQQQQHIKYKEPVTALAYGPSLAVGFESGQIWLLDSQFNVISTTKATKQITQMAWNQYGQLAIASQDGSVRII